jgi:DNA-binding MarR family transcriptional regulator
MTIYDPATFDIRTAVPPLIGRVRSAFMGALDARLAPFDVKAADYVVLATIAEDMADTTSTVCSILAHDPGAMTRKIDALEARGLVRRVRSAEDRRAVKLELTPEGKKAFPKMRVAAVQMVNDMLHGFTKAEVRAMEEMLMRILANADAMERGEAPAREARR